MFHTGSSWIDVKNKTILQYTPSGMAGQQEEICLLPRMYAWYRIYADEIAITYSCILATCNTGNLLHCIIVVFLCSLLCCTTLILTRWVYYSSCSQLPDKQSRLDAVDFHNVVCVCVGCCCPDWMFESLEQIVTWAFIEAYLCVCVSVCTYVCARV